MNRKMIPWVVAVIAVLAAASGWYYSAGRNKIGIEATPDTNTATTTAADNAAASSTKPASIGAQAKPKLVSDVTGSSLSYKQALAIFANQRIEFNDDCKMVPNPVSVKSGTILMFDNPYRDPKTFKLDGTSYTLLGYGFKLFQLRSTKLPHVVEVICGANQGSGEITLR